MANITLNEKQKHILRLMLTGQKDVFDYTDQEMTVGSEVIDMVGALKTELDAFEESGSEPMAWFWGKYLKQEGLYKLDDITKAQFSKKQKTILEAASKGEYIAALEDKKTNSEYFEVISKVCSYIAETNAYKELNDSYRHYLAWFWAKYQEQKE
ncbi:MAG: hypothetical protein LBC84_09250 [Prevotellaceae bacterium]|jgi:hypothetical protein|nr:hypothetical protein [Prevotellaceae bacterium]